MAERHRGAQTEPGTADGAAELQGDVADAARHGLGLRDSPKHSQGTRGQGESRARTLCDFTLNSGGLHSSHSGLCPSPPCGTEHEGRGKKQQGKNNSS